MENASMIRRFSVICFLLFLFLPYLLLIFRLGEWGSIDFSEYNRILLKSCSHSVVTSVISLIFGYWGACGLIGLTNRYRSITEFLYLLPNFVPTLFVILSCLNLVQPFPFGFWGVVLVQVVMNVGLASVLIVKLFEENFGGLIEHAMVDGAKAFQIHKTILPQLKFDLILLFLLIFSFCFSGFAIPSMVGLGEPWSIEVLIFEKLKVISSWPEALTLSALQSIVVFLFVIFLPKPQFLKQDYTRNIVVLKNKLGLIIPLFCTLTIFLGTMSGIKIGFNQINDLPILKQNLISQSFGTLFIGLMAGGFTFFVLNLFLYSWPVDKFQKFLLSYIPPSLVLTGFVFLTTTQGYSLLKISLGLSLLLFPVVYKMKWFSQLQKLQNQKIMAESLGATPFLIFSKILFPQSMNTAFFLSGIVAFWAAGDFAFSKIIAGEDISVALVVQGLVSSYRLELASLLIWWMLILGLLCYLFFVGMNYVFGKKLIS